MDSLILIDDIIQDYVIEHNPLHGLIIADYLMNANAKTIRDEMYRNEEDASYRPGTDLDKKLYSIRLMGDIFWLMFMRYSQPTCIEYFGWVRSLLIHIGCFMTLLNYKPKGLYNVTKLEQIMDAIARYMDIKEWTFAKNGGGQYIKDLKDKPRLAFRFILSLYDREKRNKFLQLEKCEALQDLLALLRDCIFECLGKLYRTYGGDRPAFTSSETYTRRFIQIGSDIDIGGTPNQYLRYPEILQLRWDSFQDGHRYIAEKDNQGHGPLLELVQKMPREKTEKVAAINQLLFYSLNMTNLFAQLVEDFTVKRNEDGSTAAKEFTKTRVPWDLYDTDLQNQNMTFYNYQVALSILLSDPIPLKEKDVGAKPDAPLQKPVKPKPLKEEKDSVTIIWFLLVVGIGWFAINS